MYERYEFRLPPYQSYDGYGYYGYHGGNSQMPPQPQTTFSPYDANDETPFAYFAKPPQPLNWPKNITEESAPNGPPKTGGLFTYFQDEHGQMDIEKMFSTVSQFANTFQQMTPVVKQIGSLIQSFR